MTNNDFKNKLNELLQPFGFKKKGNYWRIETDELEKIIYLQKSNFSNLYYINYGFKLKGLKYDEVMDHVGGRLHQSDIFDLENTISSHAREKGLEQIVNKDLVPILMQVNTENDLLDFIKSRPTINDITLKVKEYLHIN